MKPTIKRLAVLTATAAVALTALGAPVAHAASTVQAPSRLTQMTAANWKIEGRYLSYDTCNGASEIWRDRGYPVNCSYEDPYWVLRVYH